MKTEELDRRIFSYEIEKKIYISVWHKADVQKILEITDEELKNLIERTGKKCKLLSWKKSFNYNLEKTSDEYVTSILMYQLIYTSSELKKYKHLEIYIEYFSQKAINDLIRFQGIKTAKPKKKVKNPNYDYEMQGEFNAKRYDSDLKIPNLDIEDKSHLFYGKKIVITGSFENFRKRQVMAEMIKNVGGDNNTSISKQTDYVIVGTDAGPAKLKKIQELGIKTLSEQEFIELFPENC